MAAEGLPVQVCCRMLEVSESGYYAWRSRPPSAQAIRHAWLTDTIRQVHAASRQAYGSRRVHAELTLGRGITVGYHAVELLMRRAGLQGVTGRPKSDVACDLRRPPGHCCVALAEGMLKRRSRSWISAPMPARRTPAPVGCVKSDVTSELPVRSTMAR